MRGADSQGWTSVGAFPKETGSQHAGARSHGSGDRGASPPTRTPRIPPTIHQMLGLFEPDWRRPRHGPIDPLRLDFPGLSADARAAMRSWQVLNPRHAYRLWDAADVEALVALHYPALLPAWRALPHAVERADLGRYLVVHRHGGVYADADVAALQPMDEVLRPGDALVAAWENVIPLGEVTEREFGRHAQLLQWWFAAEAGHPALAALAARVAAAANVTFYANPRRDTIERSGPGPFTDEVLRAAVAAPRGGAAAGAPTVTVLPQAAAGFQWTNGARSLLPRSSLHLFAGSWKENPVKDGPVKEGKELWNVQRSEGEGQAGGSEQQPGELPTPAKPLYEADYVPPGVTPLLPTTCLEEPRFVVLHHGLGLGVPGDRVDAGLALMRFGALGPGGDVSTPSRTLRAFFEACERHQRARTGARDAAPATLVDVGAGYGMLALAAAARGYRVRAFEAAPRAAQALHASIAHNGFQRRVTLVEGVLRPNPAEEPASGAPTRGDAPLVCLSPRGEAAAHGYAGEGGGFQADDARNGTRAALEGCPAGQPRAAVHRAASALGGLGTDLAGLRLNAWSWGGRLAQELAPALTRAGLPPVLLELPSGPRDVPPGQESAALALAALYRAGYVHARHWGDACRARWDAERAALLDGLLGGGNLDGTEARGCALTEPELGVLASLSWHQNATEVYLVTGVA
ncbi:hypothetical protein ACKKBG_A29870 [Auxenochlorella protothecoides x Auxenochlorella symbiontica]